jgi:hypothetical protein
MVSRWQITQQMGTALSKGEREIRVGLKTRCHKTMYPLEINSETAARTERLPISNRTKARRCLAMLRKAVILFLNGGGSILMRAKIYREEFTCRDRSTQ